MNFRKVNNITGWVVCAIASLVYILTAEKAGSFWDCGEFVSAAYKVQMPHPPGAPLFVLLGRLFIVLFGDNPMTAAKAVNIMNALASGFTILFLFWTITHFARKLMVGLKVEPTIQQMYTIMGAGIVGALAYTFTDSFWFSAVEGEVYAFSSFFTALIFWGMLKWEHADEHAGTEREARNRADRWIVFISFMMGLSIGVHLLGLLTIPAIVMIYYYRRYNYTRWGAIWAFIIGCIITGIVQVVVIQQSVKIAGKFDILFVNSFHLPFFSGFIFFFLLLAVLIWWGLRVARRKDWNFLQLGLWCFSFMMLGYSSYITTMERSNANPSIDMNNVDNPMNLVYYLGRDQYGSQPILTGPHFLAQPTGMDERKTMYSKATNSYVEYPSASPDYQYDSKDIQLFPRVWDGNDPNHANYYIQWLNLPMVSAKTTSIVTGVGEGVIQTQDQTGQAETYQIPDNYAPRVRRGQVVQAGQPVAVKIPSYADNIQWFLTYQMGFMYWRYFMWNFSGRQNDIEGSGNRRDGNWIAGIPVIDNMRLGDQSKMPASIKDNKAHNNMLMIPFLLGMIGCVYQFFKNRKDWVVAFLLFFFTGIAIVIYLNQPGNQPRERDYAYAGSFYAYAIWIGLSVVAFVRMAREIEDKQTYMNTLVYGGLATLIVLIMSDANSTNGNTVIASILGALLYGLLTAVVTYVVRAVGKTNYRATALVATALCLIAPIIMGAQEWDDHDRSQKTLAPDIAKDYLNSCPKNAILFTFGDNDTYPLWYAQEVEGVRPDIRIINTSLLGIDWYVNQLRYKVNQSAPIDVIWSEDQIRGLSYIPVQEGAAHEGVYDLLDVMKNAIGAKQNPISYFPAVKHLSVNVDTAAVRNNNEVEPKDTVAKQIVLDLPEGKDYYTLDQLAMLNIVAGNAWKRPICFTSTYSTPSELGLTPYLRQQGLIFELVPMKGDSRGNFMALNTSYNLLTTKFRSGGANIPGVYFDEENRRHLLSIRQTYGLTAANLADVGRKPEAINVLNKSEQLISTKDLPYAMTSREGHNQIGMLYLESAYKAGYFDLANKIKAGLLKDLTDQINYYNYLKNFKYDYYVALTDDEAEANRFLKIIGEMEKNYTTSNKVIPENPAHKDTTKSSSRK
jgi:hypothetical protein